MMQAHPNANATSIFTSSGKAAREYARLATASMVGVNIGVASPLAPFPFGGAKDSFFGDLKAHGRDAYEFYTDKKVVISTMVLTSEAGQNHPEGEARGIPNTARRVRDPRFAQDDGGGVA